MVSPEFGAALLNLILNNQNIAGLGDATGVRGSIAAGTLYISAHSSTPAGSNLQSTGEVSFGSYARIPINRDGTVFSVDDVNATAINNAEVSFAECDSGGDTINFVGIGTSPTGDGELLLFGSVSEFTVVPAIRPRWSAGSLILAAV